MNDSLAKVHPELVSEWSEKNLSLMPVTLRSVQIKMKSSRGARPRWYSTVRTPAASCRKITMSWAFFEHNILHHLEQVDGIVLRCREEMIYQAGKDSLPL